jgi:predicted nucleic-acid-binding protein
MVAVDTNVVVRLLAGDGSAQTATARSLFATEPVWIAKTVLLETAWGLRSLCGFEASAVCEAVRGLCGLDDVHTEDEAAITAALALTEHGLELADALRLSSRPAGARFASFDKALVRRAKRAGAPGIFAA